MPPDQQLRPVAHRLGTDALFTALTAGQVQVHGLDGPACAIRSRQHDPGT
jgi:hypothetical protein